MDEYQLAIMKGFRDKRHDVSFYDIERWFRESSLDFIGDLYVTAGENTNLVLWPRGWNEQAINALSELSGMGIFNVTPCSFTRYMTDDENFNLSLFTRFVIASNVDFRDKSTLQCEEPMVAFCTISLKGGVEFVDS